jgi:hypothetical protein
VAGETLYKGADHTLETMLHEAAHVLAKVRGVQDTSRQGRWHNQRFRAMAEEMGLEHPNQIADPKHGFTDVVLTPGTREEYASVIADLDRAIRLYVKIPETLSGVGGGGEKIELPGGGRPARPGAKPGNTNNVKAVCGCEVPRIIRVSRKVLEADPIICGRCREEFGPEETSS